MPKNFIETDDWKNFIYFYPIINEKFVMNRNTIQLKHSVVFGAITGSAIGIIMLLLFFFAMMNNKALSNLSGFIFILGGYISVRYYRNEINGGFISYGKAYGTTFLTFLFAGIVWAIFKYILYKYLSPALLNEELLEMQENLLKIGWSEARVEAFTTLRSPSAFSNALGYFMNAALWGAILSLLIAALIKREENPLLKDE
jgi:hypothetical protein